jgi:Anti-sigma-K factor rskA
MLTPEDHERAAQLLGGYVLKALTDADSSEADRLLADHVPGCRWCQQTLAELQEVAADLALAATPMPVPETLLPRLKREIESATRRRRPVQLIAVAASVAAVVGLAGMAAGQEVRANHSRARVREFSQALDTVMQPDASVRQMGRISEIVSPHSTVAFLYGSGVPEPPSGREYRIWSISQDGGARFLGLLVIDEGVAFARLVFDSSVATEILITVEPSGSAAEIPGEVRWRAAA